MSQITNSHVGPVRHGIGRRLLQGSKRAKAPRNFFEKILNLIAPKKNAEGPSELKRVFAFAITRNSEIKHFTFYHQKH